MAPSSRIRFGDFDADLGAGRLWRRGEPIRLQDLPFRLLTTLIERRGELVTRAELGRELWGTDTFVDFDAGLNTAVAKLRDALGDNADRPVFIETIPKRGYRFIGQIEPADAAGHAPAAAPPTRTAPWRRAAVAALAILAIGVAAVAAYRMGRETPRVRIAVALFDNETGRAELDRLAQTLTDSTVMTLAARSQLAVIGNAAILRTDRPFRDLKKIGDELRADFVIIGQVQQAGDRVRVLAHLIRTEDQSHLWVNEFLLESADHEKFESSVAGQVASEVLARVLEPR